jgi:hypothetical protein
MAPTWDRARGEEVNMNPFANGGGENDGRKTIEVKVCFNPPEPDRVYRIAAPVP